MGLFKKDIVPILVIVHVGRSPRPKDIKLVKSEDRLKKLQKSYEKEYNVKMPLIRGFNNGATGLHWEYMEIE